MTPDYAAAVLQLGKVGAVTFIGAFGGLLFLLMYALM